jgi:hypothetical protein
MISLFAACSGDSNSLLNFSALSAESGASLGGITISPSIQAAKWPELPCFRPVTRDFGQRAVVSGLSTPPIPLITCDVVLSFQANEALRGQP